MVLDFSFLDSQPGRDAPETRNRDGQTPTNPDRLPQTPPEPGKAEKVLQIKADQAAAEKEYCSGVLKEYQRNIKLSEQYRSEILKGAKAGTDIKELFLKAAEVISLLTSDKLFYNQLKDTVKR